MRRPWPAGPDGHGDVPEVKLRHVGLQCVRRNCRYLPGHARLAYRHLGRQWHHQDGVQSSQGTGVLADIDDERREGLPDPDPVVFQERLDRVNPSGGKGQPPALGVDGDIDVDPSRRVAYEVVQRDRGVARPGAVVIGAVHVAANRGLELRTSKQLAIDDYGQAFLGRVLRRDRQVQLELSRPGPTQALWEIRVRRSRPAEISWWRTTGGTGWCRRWCGRRRRRLGAVDVGVVDVGRAGRWSVDVGAVDLGADGAGRRAAAPAGTAEGPITSVLAKHSAARTPETRWRRRSGRGRTGW